MDYRGLVLIAAMSGAGILAVTSCTAPNPAEITYGEPRGVAPIGTSGSDPGEGGTSSGEGGATDGGGEASGPVTAFSGAGAYNAAGAAQGSSNQAANHPNAGNPAGVDCMSCHGPAGGAGSKWGIAGTVYTDGTGATPVEKAEIRVVDSTGKELALVYSDALGNFWSDTIVGGIPAGAKVGARKGATALMSTSLTAADSSCNRTGCHVVGGQGRVNVQ